MSEIVIEQRMRNHLICYFELASDTEALLTYQEDAPIADVLSELINQLEDFFDINGLERGWYPEPVYSREEIDACKRFHEIWYMLDLLPEQIATIQDFLSSNYWPPFRDEAKRALSVFRKRGFFSDEKAEFNKVLKNDA